MAHQSDEKRKEEVYPQKVFKIVEKDAKFSGRHGIKVATKLGKFVTGLFFK